ncbi:MAG: 10 kDa chaperonin [Parcubacteria group bacterium GW2011_GWB1_35_5]|nr:MAG: 10 kDa chaperonin [Parcubacteria group bacterium GW2011_GWB1_35_5]
MKKVIKTKKKAKISKKVNKKTNFSIVPLDDRILLKPFSEEEMNTTSSGIIIPDTVSKEKPEQGRVIAVGEGKWAEGGKRIPVSVKVGDRVVFSRYGYEEIKYEGEEYYILKEENILAVIKN